MLCFCWSVSHGENIDAGSEETDGLWSNKPMEKRHIFYSGGWGASGANYASPALADLKVVKQTRKSWSEGPNDHPQVHAQRTPSSRIGGTVGRLRQLFISRGWGPGWT